MTGVADYNKWENNDSTHSKNIRMPNNSIKATGNKPLRFFARVGCPLALFLSLGSKKRLNSFREYKMTHTSSFDITSADDFFHKIVTPQYKDFGVAGRP